MNWPQWLTLGVMVFSLGIHAAMHGKSRTGRYDFWVALTSTAINWWVLWMGGFWG